MIVCADVAGVATVEAGHLYMVHKLFTKSSGIHTLVIEDGVAEQLPPDVNWLEFKGLSQLQINMPLLQSLPSGMALPETLKVLSFRGCGSLTALTLPFNTCVMDTNLEVLDLTDCRSLEELPSKTCELLCLQRLVLNGCSNLKALPVKFGALRNLTMLDLRGCDSLPDCTTGTRLVTASVTETSSSCRDSSPKWASLVLSLETLETIMLSLTSSSWDSICKEKCYLEMLANKVVLEVDVQDVYKQPDGQDELRKLWSGSIPAGIKGLVVKTPSLQLLPDDLNWARFTNLQQLDIKQPPDPLREIRVQTDWDVDSSVSGLSSASQYRDSLSAETSPAPNSTRLPNGICRLWALTELAISGWSELQELPAGLPHLTRLEKINLSGCRAIERLPRGFELCRELTHLDLSGCKSLKCLPHNFGRLSKLTHLDLSGCKALCQLPESIQGITALQKPGAVLRLKGCDVPQRSPRFGRAFRDLPIKRQLQRICALQRQNAAVEMTVIKLAQQQEPMLTTLERMSWLVVLLATATFIAYLQPPGGLEGTKVSYYSQADSCLARLHNRSTPITGSSGQIPLGNQTTQGSGNQTAPNLDFENRACAAAAYYMWYGLSFGLSIGCVMTIVVLSMPRMQWADDKAEAGRFYLLLLLTWVLLYLAVTTGLCTFIASGLVSHGNPKIVVVPVGPGIALVAIGLGLLIRRFRSLFPGWDALRTALVFTWSWADRELRPVEDAAEMGQDKFWRYCFHKLPRDPETFSAGGLPVSVIADSSVQLATRGTLGMVFPHR